MNSETTLITGAGSGIGLALALEFAKHNHSLILTSRIEEELNQIAKTIRDGYGVDVRSIAVDLEQPDAAEALFDFAQREGLAVDILVNNAGLGYRGKFWEIPLEQQLSITRVNIEAVLRLT